MFENLELLFKSWDKKDTDQLKLVYEKYSSNEDFLEELVLLLSKRETEAASSWLIKNYFHRNDELKNFSNNIYRCFNDLVGWEAQLHVLQMMDSLKITSETKKLVEITLRRLLISQNKFVRAWSYNGFYILATEFPEYREEVEIFLKLGLEDEPASVKARIRNIVKLKQW